MEHPWNGRALLIFLTLATLVLVAGCGADGAGQAEKPSASSGQQPKGPGGGTAKLGTPALGSAAAPVVLTEYSDYQ